MDEGDDKKLASCFVENGIMEIVKVRALRTSHYRRSEDGPTNSMILELSDCPLSPDESSKEIYRSPRNWNFCLVYQRKISMRTTLGGKCLRQIHRWVSSKIVQVHTILSTIFHINWDAILTWRGSWNWYSYLEASLDRRVPMITW